MNGTHRTRRRFLQHIGLGILSAPAGISLGASVASSIAKRPNILLIITDQQSASMLSCAGNRWLKTPAMDSVMKRGMRFERAYATNPVCIPSRFSLMTGHYPSAVRIRKNRNSNLAARFLPTTLGRVFKGAGYDTVYGGKVHLPSPMRRVTDCGFRLLTSDERDILADECVRFLLSTQVRPFFLVASFINPHDICYQAIRACDGRRKMNSRAIRAIEVMREAEKTPRSVSEDEFYAKHCPPLPDNHEPTEPEPKAITEFIDRDPVKRYVRENWTGRDWRLHRWTYARLTERVDDQIGRVLGAVRKAGLEDNTVVIITSDHGEMDGAHRIEQKSLAYEQSANVPLLVQYPPLTEPGLVDREHVVSNGLDIFPTLCDIAGIAGPPDLPGRSFKALLGSARKAPWREYLMIETEPAYALTDGRFKYTLFDFAGPEEMLCDLKRDPGEMKNLVADPHNGGTLSRMRAGLTAEAKKQGHKIQFPIHDVGGY
ncbi:MAG: sulfatase-like hydrolase/transferase [Phycisphaerales bacterium]|nr:MAG: sulfatase-like hydrolase/transferase [Phycisphaerales bacterium]